MTEAYAARTRGELERITADLPALAGPAVVGARRRATRWTVAVLGDASQKGRWRGGRRQPWGVAVMGDCTIDLGAAEFGGQEIVVTAVSVMGDVTVLVPEGVDVELGGVALMGAKNDQVRPVPVVAGTPLVRVRAVAVMGEVTLRSVAPSRS